MSAQGKYSGDYFGLYFGGAGGGNLSGTCSISVSAQGDLRGGGAGGYDDDKPSKPRRFIQKVGNRLIVTTDASAALAAAQQAQEAIEAPLPPADEKPAAQEISLAEIRAVAAQYQQQAKVLQMFRQRDWAEMVALYEALKRQQDEDDIEMVLLSL